MNRAHTLVSSTVVSLSAALALAAGDTNPFTHTDPDGNVPVLTQTGDATRNPIRFGAPWDSPRAGSPTFVSTGSGAEGDNPADVEFTADGSTILIAHRESHTITMWDAATNAYIDDIWLPGAPQSIALTPSGAKALVTLLDTNLVAVVDLAMRSVEASIPVGLNPGPIVVNDAGDLAAVGITGEGSVQVIDLGTTSVVRTIADIGYTQTFSFNTESPAFGLKFSEFASIGGDRIVNADSFAGEAQFIDIRTGTVNRLPIAGSVGGLAVSGDQSTIAVSHTFSARTLTVLDASTETITSTYTPPVDLWGPITLNTDGTRGVVAVQNAARTVDLTTGTFGPSINTASLNALYTTFDGQRAVGIGYNGPVIDIATGALYGFANAQVSTDVGAVSPTSDLAAMCSTTFGDDLVVIETDTTPALQTYQLSGELPEGDRARTLAVSPDGSTTAVVSILSDTLTVIDNATNTVTGWAPLGARPSGVAITPDGTRAVVANLDSTYATIVDLATATSTDVPISYRGSRVAISPDGAYAYIPVLASGDGVWRIDIASGTVAGAKITTGNQGGVGYAYSQTSDMELSPDGTLLAVAGSFDNNVTFVDTTTWSLIGNLPAGDFPTYLAFSPDGNMLAVANRNADTVTFLNTSNPATPIPVGFANVGDFPAELAFSDDGRCFVINQSDDTIGVINTTTRIQTSTIPFADTVIDLEVNLAERRLYVAWGNATTTFGGEFGFDITQEGYLSVFDLDTLALIETVSANAGPSDLAVAASGSFASLAAPLGDGAVVISLSDACNDADLTEPYGTLNIDDVLAFLDAFATSDPAADIAPPTGTFNIDDVLAFLDAFASGCP